jgi:pseudouridine-5'-phosphate glycosidase
MSGPVTLHPELAAAVARGEPVVAMESALITHGFAYPASVAVARRMARAIREVGAHPATVAIWQGMPVVGLDDDRLAALASDAEAVKVSVRDLALSVVRQGNGGTTVAATSLLARRAGIRVFATGGIGGVHRGHPEDVSADLPVLASTPIVVVCAGAKSILDLPRTLEYLETWGVPVLGWQTDEFPAFYSRSSGLPVDLAVQSAADVVRIFRAQRRLDLPQALLVAAPVPEEAEVPSGVVEPLIAQAVAEAEAQGVAGKALTPFILDRMVALSEERTRYANEQLLVQNAAVAAQIAVAFARAAADA